MSVEAVFDGGAPGNFVSKYNPEIIVVSNEQTQLLIKNLELTAIAIANAIEGIYTNAGNLSKGWEGKDYNQYLASVTSYRPYLETFLLFISAYRNLLTKLDGDIETLYSTINGLLEIA